MRNDVCWFGAPSKRARRSLATTHPMQGSSVRAPMRLTRGTRRSAPRFTAEVWQQIRGEDWTLLERLATAAVEFRQASPVHRRVLRIGNRLRMPASIGAAPSARVRYAPGSAAAHPRALWTPLSFLVCWRLIATLRRSFKILLVRRILLSLTLSRILLLSALFPVVLIHHASIRATLIPDRSARRRYNDVFISELSWRRHLRRLAST